MQRDFFISQSNVADVRVAQGDLADALTSYLAVRSTSESLSKADPSNAEWQHGLAIFYEKVGDAQVAQGDLAAALNPIPTASPSATASPRRIPVTRNGSALSVKPTRTSPMLI